MCKIFGTIECKQSGRENHKNIVYLYANFNTIHPSKNRDFSMQTQIIIGVTEIEI